ncbi:MAG: NAD(P)-dependent oxidoreductase [Betaproteobacteria bacterium]
MSVLARIGVIGTGLMGLGVVRSLVRNGFEVHARDIRVDAQADAVAAGAWAADSPASLAHRCDVVIVLVVDAPQVETVLFAHDGAADALARGSIVLLSSTVAPAFVAAAARRLGERGITLLDAPVSGGPQRAESGTLTMMISGDSASIERCAPVLAAISARRFDVGTQPGVAATFKVLNNQLAAANLAAGAEAMALAAHAGIDLRALLEVINASSGASWIVNDRMRRLLDDDATVHAAMTLLAKDVGIAAENAAGLDFDAPMMRAAHAAFAGAVNAGYAPRDDSALVDYTLRRDSERRSKEVAPSK